MFVTIRFKKKKKVERKETGSWIAYLSVELYIK